MSLESPVVDHAERMLIILVILAVLGMLVSIKYHQSGIKKLISTAIQNFSQISVDDRSSDTDATLTTVTPLSLSPHTISNSNSVHQDETKRFSDFIIDIPEPDSVSCAYNNLNFWTLVWCSNQLQTTICSLNLNKEYNLNSLTDSFIGIGERERIRKIVLDVHTNHTTPQPSSAA